jgi:adenosylcobinamide kinase/adenosylcobinamide-phosphate guanylyltransferase
MGEIWFVTGGARSGKSRFAERLATATALEVVYVATMEPLDAELEARVAHHRASRPSSWTTTEAPRELVATLRVVAPEVCVLVDCLSLWVTNRLLDCGETPSAEDVARLEAALEGDMSSLARWAVRRPAPTILVSNEVGGGIVPDNPLGRTFRDVLGRVNQQASTSASRAWLLVAGRALELPPTDGDSLEWGRQPG